MNTAATQKRPRSVTVTLLGVFLLGVWNAGRVLALYKQSDLLLALEIKPDPRARMLLAAVWTMLFWGATVALWQKRPLTRPGIPFLLLFYALYKFTLLALYIRVPMSGQEWLWYILFYVIAISFTYWALNRAATDFYFQEETTIQHEPQN